MSNTSNNLYKPGQTLTVGSHQATILSYLTSGGFAQVYKVEVSPPAVYPPSHIACLKRVTVRDKQSLNVLRAEVSAMRSLMGNRHVVSYIDSHAEKVSSTNSDTTEQQHYEVLLLMEYCSHGGLIDFLNTRLHNRLRESEVLKIMSHVCQGVAAMHRQEPPLIHRDIKIENVLISENGDFKICDFGSVCNPVRVPRTRMELEFVMQDNLRNTTAQYRSPEMLDMSRGLPIDEKSDIWALGVFLYKLCYYTTPFEKSGERAILTSSFSFPRYPNYSDRLKNLIRVMLSNYPIQRPNVCQVLEEVSRLQGVICPITNFYLERAIEMAKRNNNIDSVVSPTPLGNVQQVTVLNLSGNNTVAAISSNNNINGGFAPTYPMASGDNGSVTTPFLTAQRRGGEESTTTLTKSGSTVVSKGDAIPGFPLGAHQNYSTPTYLPPVSHAVLVNVPRNSGGNNSATLSLESHKVEGPSKRMPVNKLDRSETIKVLNERLRRLSSNTSSEPSESSESEDSFQSDLDGDDDLYHVSTGKIRRRVSAVPTSSTPTNEATKSKSQVVVSKQRQPAERLEISNETSEPLLIPDNEMKLSIRKRVEQLLRASREASSYVRSASGYGRYTDPSPEPDGSLRDGEFGDISDLVDLDDVDRFLEEFEVSSPTRNKNENKNKNRNSRQQTSLPNKSETQVPKAAAYEHTGGFQTIKPSDQRQHEQTNKSTNGIAQSEPENSNHDISIKSPRTPPSIPHKPAFLKGINFSIKRSAKSPATSMSSRANSDRSETLVDIDVDGIDK